MITIPLNRAEPHLPEVLQNSPGVQIESAPQRHQLDTASISTELHGLNIVGLVAVQEVALVCRIRDSHPTGHCLQNGFVLLGEGSYLPASQFAQAVVVFTNFSPGTHW
jgi:hypothetical protein